MPVAPKVRVELGETRQLYEMPLVNRYRVRALPTLLIFKNGEAREQFAGADFTKDQLRAKLEARMG